MNGNKRHPLSTVIHRMRHAAAAKLSKSHRHYGQGYLTAVYCILHP